MRANVLKQYPGLGMEFTLNDRVATLPGPAGWEQVTWIHSDMPNLDWTEPSVLSYILPGAPAEKPVPAHAGVRTTCQMFTMRSAPQQPAL